MALATMSHGSGKRADKHVFDRAGACIWGLPGAIIPVCRAQISRATTARDRDVNDLDSAMPNRDGHPVGFPPRLRWKSGGGDDFSAIPSGDF
ncbi:MULTISPECIES: hypothetical protein [Xanthomonas]|uniref:hypothetical protein n=1 Tax=Xanthomonas TaxID=338 RepID=UPI0013749D81|nr:MULTISPECIES: hypothetical protein [Xanthomonas]